MDEVQQKLAFVEESLSKYLCESIEENWDRLDAWLSGEASEDLEKEYVDHFSQTFGEAIDDDRKKILVVSAQNVIYAAKTAANFCNSIDDILTFVDTFLSYQFETITA